MVIRIINMPAWTSLNTNTYIVYDVRNRGPPKLCLNTLPRCLYWQQNSIRLKRSVKQISDNKYLWWLIVLNDSSIYGIISPVGVVGPFPLCEEYAFVGNFRDVARIYSDWGTSPIEGIFLRGIWLTGEDWKFNLFLIIIYSILISW